MSVSLRLPAPAKVNLMLHITGQREDGYHLLQTVFRFLDFGDEIEFSLTYDGKIQRLQGGPGITANDDLVVKAARLMQPLAGVGVSRGVDITVHKKIPVGAGLGGGSSDAATTLLALNQLWQCDLSTDVLADIGLQLGADVPVFVRGYTAFAEGVGEHLTPIELPPAWYLIVTPQVHVSTAEIFTASELTRDCPALKICDLLRAGDEAVWDNVCTPVVSQRYPQVASALALLGEVASARMSGTGASVFAEFDSEQAAQKALAELTDDLPSDWNIVIAEGLETSPLQSKLKELKATE
jgi:4-diphosphocytidyl-2-C-methyl-D-erythritol kinase